MITVVDCISLVTEGVSASDAVNQLLGIDESLAAKMRAQDTAWARQMSGKSRRPSGLKIGQNQAEIDRKVALARKRKVQKAAPKTGWAGLKQKIAQYSPIRVKQ